MFAVPSLLKGLKAKNPARSSDPYCPISNIKVWRRNFHHALGWCQLMQARLPCNLKGFKTKAPSCYTAIHIVLSNRWSFLLPAKLRPANCRNWGKYSEQGSKEMLPSTNNAHFDNTLLQLNLVKGKPLIAVPPPKARSSLWWSISHFYEALFITNGSKPCTPSGTGASPTAGKTKIFPRLHRKRCANASLTRAFHKTTALWLWRRSSELNKSSRVT